MAGSASANAGADRPFFMRHPHIPIQAGPA